MSNIRVAINGFGRIGRNAFKIAWERSDIEVVAVNDLHDTEMLAHLLRYDSTYGEYARDIVAREGEISIDGQSVRVLREGEPTRLPWREMNVDVVLECTGVFTESHRVRGHLEAGAKRVILSAPPRDESVPIIMLGVNEDKLQSDAAISAGSCVSNAIGPVLSILQDAFGIEAAMVSTIHSYDNSQRVQDAPLHDWRRSRAAGDSIVPIVAGGLGAALRALPQLQGRVSSGVSYRVPVPIAALSEITALVSRDVSRADVNMVFERAASDPFYQGILTTTDKPLVSIDFRGDSHSSTVDLSLTAVAGSRLVKIATWFDNEWGYANRLLELAVEANRTPEETSYGI